MFQRRREDRARSVRRADAPSGLRGLAVVSGRTNPDRTKQGSARWMRAGRRLIVFRDREDKSVPRPRLASSFSIGKLGEFFYTLGQSLRDDSGLARSSFGVRA